MNPRDNISRGHLALVFLLLFVPSAAWAAECARPTRESDFQTRDACTDAICCPRPLAEQVNLVKAVTRGLRQAGYYTEDEGQVWTYSPIKSPAFRDAIIDYKKSHGLQVDDKITYALVESLLGVNLFNRWNTADQE